MTIGWNEAEPPALPAPTVLARLRRGGRMAVAAVATGSFFGVFLALTGIDTLRRAIALRPVPALAPWAVQAWAHVALALLGLGFHRTGAPMRHPGAIVANHATWLDVIVLQRALQVFFVSKSEVAGWPLIGRIGRAIGTMFIERRPVEARRQAQALQARLARGDLLCIFPEGTSSDGRRVLPFKSALFGVFFEPDLHARLWVQPVTIAYRAPPGLPPQFYGWWGGMNFAAHLADVLAFSVGGRVEIVFHPPLRPADFADRKALAARAEAAVRSGLEAIAQRLD